MRIQTIFLAGALLFTINTEAQTASGAPDKSGATVIGATLGVQQAVTIAIKNNLLVNQTDITRQQSRVALDQAYGNLLPSISANLSQGIGFGRTPVTSSFTYTDEQTASGSYSATGNLLLFQGLRYQNIVKLNRLAYHASQLDLEQQKNNITLSVLLAYLQILSSEDLLNIAHEQADVDQKQLGRLENQNKEGALLLLSSLTDLRGQYAGDLANIAIDSNNVEQAKVALFQILNVPYKRDVDYDRNAFTIDIVDYTQNPDSIFQTALHTQPTIQAVDLRVQSFRRALSAARGAYWPQLSFYTNVQSYYSNAAVGATGGTPKFDDQVKNNRQTNLGLQLNIPILNYLSARNNVKLARISLENSAITANNTRLVLQQNVEQAYQNMISTYKQYKAFIDQAAAYSESLRTTTIRFDEGVITSDLYLLAKNKSDAANVSLSQAKYTYIFRTKVLDYYQGRLTWTTPTP